jgi:carboxymethylenebutenolidase
MTSPVEFSSRSGSKVTGVFAEPSGSEKAGAVVVIQEWWGLNDHMKKWVDTLAAQGFLALAPDLYHGAITKDAGEAGKLMNALDTHRAVDEICGAVKALKEHPRCNGKIAVAGFCMGGALSFASACHVPGLAAVVPFYGVPPAEKVDYAKVTAPVLAHFAKRDDWAKPEKAEEIQKKLRAAGKSMELHVYDAQHAFMNDTRPEVHDAACAALAWDRTLAFLRKHLA